jgi:hypothetical protein
MRPSTAYDRGVRPLGPIPLKEAQVTASCYLRFADRQGTEEAVAQLRATHVPAATRQNTNLFMGFSLRFSMGCHGRREIGPIVRSASPVEGNPHDQDGPATDPGGDLPRRLLGLPTAY